MQLCIIGQITITAVLLSLLAANANAGCVDVDTDTDYGCGDTVTKSCTLNGNMTCPDGSAGLIIGADGIVIDGNNYTITGSTTNADCEWGGEAAPCTISGIYNAGYDNVVIRNLEIEGFCTGIVLKGSGPNRVRNNTIDNCKIHDNGFNIKSGGSDMVTHGIHACWIDAGDGGEPALTIKKNDIYDNEGTGSACGDGGNGIFIYAGSPESKHEKVVISCNKIHDNAKAGFWTKMMLDQSEITYNEIWGNGNGSGVTDDVRGGIVLRCKKSNENLIAYNDVHDHAADGYGYGIYVGGSNNTIEYNNVTNNSMHGISMDRSDGSWNNDVSNNTVCNNGEYDIATCGSACYGNNGCNNTCDTTYYYDDYGSTGCTYNCSPAADLTIIEKLEEWTDLGNKTYNITYTIKNIGDADAGESNTSIKIDGTEVATDPVPALTQGENYTRTLGPFTMSGGSNVILICADSNNMILEKSQEYNNCLENIFIHPEMPDLTITEKSEAWVVEGSTYNITYTVKNIGTIEAEASATSIEIDGETISNDTVPALAASESYTSTLGPFTISGSNDTILICIDIDNNITEVDEDNNCKENTFEKPDCTCSDGTPCGECSVDKPKYCDNGVLIDDCAECGCPGGEICDEELGSCYLPGVGGCITGDGTVFACGDTVTKSCTLSENMICPSGSAGLIIGADNIVIDGNGYGITGSTTNADCEWAGETSPCTISGIYNEGYDNVVIRNLEIEDFCTGIALKGTGQNKVLDITIDNCRIHDNGFNTKSGGSDMVTHGIHACFVRHIEITENDICNNKGTGSACGDGGNGIFIYAGVSDNYCDINNNRLYDNAKAGFWTKMMLSKSTISHNEVWGNGDGSGIDDDVRGGIILRCKKSNENTIEYNDVHHHAADGYGYGIYVGGSSNTIRHNTVNGSTKHGISMARSDGSWDNEIYNNVVCDNGIDISVTSGVTGNTGDENTCETTYNYNDCGTTGCTLSCLESGVENLGGIDTSEEEPEEEEKKISFIEAGSNASISFNECGVSLINVYAMNDLINFSINIRQSDEPLEGETGITGIVYRYLNITTSNITDEDIINATIRFGVSRSWIQDTSIDEASIRLNRYNDTNRNWTVLPTTRINETKNDASICFEAVTQGFSLFAITGREMTVVPLTGIPDSEIAGASTWEPMIPSAPLTKTQAAPQEEKSVGWNTIPIAPLIAVIIAGTAGIIYRRKLLKTYFLPDLSLPERERNIIVPVNSFTDYFMREEYAKVEKLGDSLANIESLINWGAFCPIIADIFDDRSGNGSGANIDEVLMIKMLVLQQWYRLSDSELEQQATDRISFRRFLGFPDTIPDKSAIRTFREQLTQTGKERKIWGELHRQLDSSELAVKQGVIQDATFITVKQGHTKASKPKRDASQTRRSGGETLQCPWWWY